MSYIGKKVIITKYYDNYIGEVGEIIDENYIYFTVKMNDGHLLQPFKPSYYTPQCKFVGNYKLEDIDNKKYCINCPTEQLAIKTIEILSNYGWEWMDGISLTTSLSRWHVYKHSTCYSLDISKKLCYGTIDFYENKHFNIIPAEEFIKQNTKFEIMKTEFTVDGPKSLKSAIIEELKDRGYKEFSTDTPKYILKDNERLAFDTKNEIYQAKFNGTPDFTLPQDWDQVIKILSKDNIKVGDYVVCLEDSTGFTHDKLYKVKNPNGDFGNILIERDDNGSRTNGWHKQYFRKATLEEIEKHINRVEILNIGDNKTPIKITKNGIYVEGNEITLSTIENTIGKMTTQGYICDWKIDFDKVNIGCCKNITLEELNKIIEIHKSFK
jgi:hypothetical protein